jgi:hypothetical protein
MKFSVGHLVCSICGEFPIVTNFERSISFAAVDAADSDIVFEFADETGWQYGNMASQTYVSCSKTADASYLGFNQYIGMQAGSKQLCRIAKS